MTIAPPPSSTLSDRAAMLRTILEHPEDDAPRLVYADWLDEQGEHERAEFIRDQIRGVSYWPVSRQAGPTPSDPPVYEFGFARGFVDEVRLPCSAFMTHAAALFAAHPITAVRLVDKHLRPELADMLRVQLATGMRTGELLRMDAAEIIRTGPAWVYSPAKHKNAHRHKVRRVQIPDALKPIVAKYIKRGKLWTIGQSGYWKALRLACEAAGVNPWQPYQLRHTASTEARAAGGDAAAMAILDHVGKSLLERYTGTVDDVRMRRKAG